MGLKETLAKLAEVAAKHDLGQPYICGGVARDLQLGGITELHDVDITTGRPDVGLLADFFAGEVGSTVKTFADGHKQVFVDGVHLDFSTNFKYANIDQMLEQAGAEITDLNREMWSRDFTINALLLTLDLKETLDPTGKGLVDLKAKVLRCPLDPMVSFAESPNRLVRAWEYAGRFGFAFDDELKEAMSRCLPLLKQVKARYAGTKLNSALRRRPELLDEMIDIGLLNHVPHTKLITKMLIQKRRLLDVMGPKQASVEGADLPFIERLQEVGYNHERHFSGPFELSVNGFECKIERWSSYGKEFDPIPNFDIRVLDLDHEHIDTWLPESLRHSRVLVLTGKGPGLKWKRLRPQQVQELFDFIEQHGAALREDKAMAEMLEDSDVKKEATPKPRLSTEDAKWIDDTLLEVIRDTYANWRNRRKYDPRYPEPALTVAYLREVLEQARMPEDFKYAVKSDQDSMVRSALSRLERRGLARSSIGPGAFHGGASEARCWEPVEIPAPVELPPLDKKAAAEVEPTHPFIDLWNKTTDIRTSVSRGAKVGGFYIVLMADPLGKGKWTLQVKGVREEVAKLFLPEGVADRWNTSGYSGKDGSGNDVVAWTNFFWRTPDEIQTILDTLVANEEAIRLQTEMIDDKHPAASPSLLDKKASGDESDLPFMELIQPLANQRPRVGTPHIDVQVEVGGLEISLHAGRHSMSQARAGKAPSWRAADYDEWELRIAGADMRFLEGQLPDQLWDHHESEHLVVSENRFGFVPARLVQEVWYALEKNGPSILEDQQLHEEMQEKPTTKIASIPLLKSAKDPGDHPMPRPHVFRSNPDLDEGFGRMHDEFKAGDVGGVADYIAKMRKRPPRIKDLYERRKKRKKKLKKKASPEFELQLPESFHTTDIFVRGWVWAPGEESPEEQLETTEMSPPEAFAWAMNKRQTNRTVELAILFHDSYGSGVLTAPDTSDELLQVVATYPDNWKEISEEEAMRLAPDEDFHAKGARFFLFHSWYASGHRWKSVNGGPFTLVMKPAVRMWQSLWVIREEDIDYPLQIILPTLKGLEKKASGLTSKVIVNGNERREEKTFEDLDQAFRWARTQVEPEDGLQVAIYPIAYEEMEDGTVIDRHWLSMNGGDFIECIGSEWRNEADVEKFRQKYGFENIPKTVPYLGDFSAMMKVASAETKHPFEEYVESEELGPSLLIHEIPVEIEKAGADSWNLTIHLEEKFLDGFVPEELQWAIARPVMFGTAIRYEAIPGEIVQKTIDALMAKGADIVDNMTVQDQENKLGLYRTASEDGSNSSDEPDDQTLLNDSYCREAKEYWRKAPAKTKAEKAAVQDFVEYAGEVSCKPPKKNASRLLPSTTDVHVLVSVYDICSRQPRFLNSERFTDFGAAIKWAEANQGPDKRVSIVADFYDDQLEIKGLEELAANLELGGKLKHVSKSDAEKLDVAPAVQRSIARSTKIGIQVCNSAQVVLESVDGSPLQEKSYTEKQKRLLWWDDRGQVFHVGLPEEVKNG